jgi:tRNA-Thr(GGU) m(6)t(6)A37 methyltransferase TsaA
VPIGNSAELRRLGLGARLGQKPGADLAEHASLLGGVALVAGLKGLDPGRQVMVVFHFHRSPQQYDLVQHPRGDSSRPRRGVFSLCSPHRPNPIGVTVVDLVAVEDNVLRVHGLDAIHDTPVLDLKPA